MRLLIYVVLIARLALDPDGLNEAREGERLALTREEAEPHVKAGHLKLVESSNGG